MIRPAGNLTAAAVTLVAALGISSAASAQDFFSALFHGYQPQARAYAPERAFPFASEGDYAPRRARPIQRSYASGGGQAFCVRTCDGRYFPISATGDATKEVTCNSFCPASETKVVYGSTIDAARTSGGKPYSELPNAFKFRAEIVDGCTCNGKDHFGLAKIKLEDDPTLRRGDIVANEDGLKVASRIDRRDGAVNYSPVSAASMRAAFGKVPVVASN
ncbi:DUF2865 domain-containing protein [Rhodopseudomonas sp. HC1]|uniref:DUF2865 domain-containing protein n=1 Tax=Rhodopseudomonas infernalis TaxID=2897386 RepID=UPI001EE92690|nr:DUF2865 domain-containing protein [Rhodopseudomonas infernalis]MCG6205061.1 DUF2865 domain-containing protein [Rhodopseudomonas infernalis]